MNKKEARLLEASLMLASVPLFLAACDRFLATDEIQAQATSNRPAAAETLSAATVKTIGTPAAVTIFPAPATAEATATVEVRPAVDAAETLFNEGIDGYQSFTLITEGKARSFLNGDRRLEEVQRGVAGMAEQLINTGITKIAGPQLAQAELEALASGPVEIAILDTEDEAVPEDYYSIQARGFEAGGWGIFVEGPDGLLRVVLPRGETSLSSWVTLPTGAIDIYRLPGQATWPGGRVEIVKVPGASWQVAVVNEQGQVMALVDPAGEVDQPMTVWKTKKEMPVAKGTDELSLKIQNYLNAYYSELGISAVEEKSQPVSVEGGGLFVFAESGYGNEGKRLPLLIEIGIDLSLKNVWLLERNNNYSGGDVLVKYEYIAYSFEAGEKNVLLLQGPAVLRLKTGEFKIFFDNNWRTARSPSERHIEPLKELLTGEDYARPSGDYIVITPKPQPTEVVEANPPLVQPESLEISLGIETLNLIAQINLDNLYQPPPGPDPNLHRSEIAPLYGRADELIRIIGVQENQILRNQYMKFFNENWVVSYDEYQYQDLSYDIRGLGAETIYFKGFHGEEGLGHSQAVGFLYGFMDSYVILQIEPGNNLTPEETPEAFIAVEIGKTSRETEGLVGLLTISEYGRSYQRYIQKDGYNVPWFRYWSPIELQKYFSLLRGTIVITKGRQGNKLGTYEADMIYFFVLEIPSEEEQAGRYKLKKFGAW